MYTHGHQKLIDRMSAPRVPRRQLLQGAGAVGLAATFRATAVLAESDEDERVSRAAREEAHNICHQHRFGQFSDWSEPINLGPTVNSSVDDFHPAISNDGLSLYISSSRPEGFGPNDIWVSQGATLDYPWGPPQNLGPNINSAGDEFAPDFSPDGHWLFFSSSRPPGTLDATQIWVSYRKDADDDFGWRPAVNLGADINLPGVDDNAPTFFQDHETGITSIYFNSILRHDGPGDFDIYVSAQRQNGTFGRAKIVQELCSPYRDTRTAIRRDGLGMSITIESSRRIGQNRPVGLDAQEYPRRLVNSGKPGADDEYCGRRRGPALSCDGTTLYFYSTRPGGSGGRDLSVTTRHKIHF